MTYQPKVYHKIGGDELVVASGGKITVEAGGAQTRSVVSKAANYTCTAADSGTTFIATAADLVFTLPATVAGLWYRFVLAATGLSAGTGLSLSPAAADMIMGNGFTAVDDTDVVNTGGSDREGDMIEIIGDGVSGWYIVGVIGTWANS